MAFADNIKMLRELKGLTQAEMGAIAGVSDKAVSTWELGHKEPRMGTIERIARHFGLSIGALVEEGGLSKNFDIVPYGPTQKTPTPKDERREYLMSLIGKLTPENQRKLLDYIDLLEGSQQK